jgi:LPXTG-motif cell wall-anchored protein
MRGLRTGLASVDAGDKARLVAAATIVNGQGCWAGRVGRHRGTLARAWWLVATDQAAANTGSSNLLPLLLLGLLLFLLLLAILYVWNRRRTLLEGASGCAGYQSLSPNLRPACPVAA